MRALTSQRWLPILAIALLAACSESSPLDPVAMADDEPLTSTLPSLVSEAGTEGTDRYVPVLERILRRSVGVIRERKGDEAAARVVTEARRLRQELRTAREAGNAEAARTAQQALEGFAARVGLRVFGPAVVRHVVRDASGKLAALREGIRAAAEAGHDVTRIGQGVRTAARHLDAARDAAGRQELAAALVHAARALDLLARLHAAL